MGFSAASNLAEIAHAAVLVLGEEVVALLVYAKRHRICPRTRHFHFFAVLLMRLARQAVSRLRKSCSNLVRAGTWIFVDFDSSERSSGFHFFPSLSEAEALCLVWREGSLDIIGIWRRVLGSAELIHLLLLREVIFVPNAE